MENIPNASATNIFLTSHCIFDDLKVKGNAVGSDRVFSLHRKEVHFETGFSSAMFSKTTKVEVMERGPRFAGGMNTTVRNEGLVLCYRMC